jgi:putative transposase
MIDRATLAGEVTVVRLCDLFGVSRQAYYAARNGPVALRPRPAPPPLPARGVSTADLKEKIRLVIDAQPAWGHRKVWATLRRNGTMVGRRRVAEVMSANGDMQAPRERRGPPRRVGQVVVPEPNRRFATDLTTVWTRRDGLIAIALTVDCGCRSVLDVTSTKSQAAPMVLSSVERALEWAFGDVDHVPDGLELRSDHGSQYTGSDAADLARRWRLNQTFAPVGRPTGNAVAERTIQTMKLECLWLEDFEDQAAVQAALNKWANAFNHERPHQALKWKTPAEFRAEKLGPTSQQAAA